MHSHLQITIGYRWLAFSLCTKVCEKKCEMKRSSALSTLQNGSFRKGALRFRFVATTENKIVLLLLLCNATRQQPEIILFAIP